MKAIKFLLGLGLMIASSSVFSQGLEGIVVEKYYQASSLDLTLANDNAAPASATLNANSVTYRVYVNLADGYKLNAVYGNAAHPATFSTTTYFYNHGSYGAQVGPTVSNTNIVKNSALLDSYFTLGKVGSDKVGVIESEDTDANLTNFNGILQNNPGGTCFGAPIFGTGGKDGLTAISASTGGSINSLGLDTPASLLDALGDVGGSTVTFNGGSFASLSGVVGPTSSNMVLIGQFTTDGVFTFSFNVQVQLTGGTAQNYVYSNATGSEIANSSLTLAPNTAPTVSVAGTIVSTGLAAGANIINGTAMKFTATANDNVSVTDVKFYDGTTLLSTDDTAPYEHLYTAVAGNHSITAVATDGQCVATTSTAYTFTSAANQAPTLTLTTAPQAVTSGTTTTVVGTTMTITSVPTDVDGTVAEVEFFLNGVSLVVDNTAPFTTTFTATLGSGQTIKAIAKDNLGLITAVASQPVVTLNVLANVPPTVSLAITSPAAPYDSYASSSAGTLLPINLTATAADSDGTVTQVEFFVDGVSLSVDQSSPYTAVYPSIAGTRVITAKATDSNGAITTSTALTIVVNDLLALPYEVKNVTQLCNLPTFCVPVAVASTYTVDNVKGYDIVMTYDANKVAPIENATTGYNVTVFNALNVTPSQVDVSAAIQTPGTLNLSLYFNGSAPANAEWNGTNANIFCVQFERLAGFTPFDESTVAVTFLQESRITGVQQVSVTSGKMFSTTMQDYTASLDYWSGNGDIAYNAALPNAFLITNIQGVFANGTATAVAPVQPNVTGVFTHVLNTVVNSVKTAVPNIDIKRDVNNLNSVFSIVNSSDAVIAKTILLNQQLAGVNPSVYQMIACDVNRDGVVSAGDVSQMQQRTVGILGEYLQAGFYNAEGTPIANAGPSRDWLFIDPIVLLPIVGGQANPKYNPAYTIGANFPFPVSASEPATAGYHKGKVPVVPLFLPTNISNYTANDATCPTVGTAAYKGIMLGDANGSYATYTADGILKGNEADYILVDLGNAIVEGTKVSVPVSIVSEESVNAFDLALGLNENTLSYVSMEDTQLGSSSAAFYNENDKTFRHTSFNTNNFSANARVAFFTFETVDGTISEKDFTSELGLLNDKSVAVRFTKSADLVNNSVDIYPNPSNGMFTVTSKVDGRVDIVDVTGKLVHPGVIVKANQMIEVNMPELGAGVYFVRMYSNNSMTTERIVIGE